MRIKIAAVFIVLVILMPWGDTYADISGSYAVQEVVGPDSVRIAFHGLPVVVRLANIQAHPDAKAELEKLVKGENVSIRYVTELGFDEDGTPYVNMAAGPALARVIVNVELVKLGVADYDTNRAPSAAYDAQFKAALKEAQEGRKGMWAKGVPEEAEPETAAENKPAEKPGPAPVRTADTAPVSGSGIVAEINSSFYHLTSCPSTRFLSKRNIVRYASPEAAEKAGKRPCSRCQAARAATFKAQHSETAKRKYPGPLIGLKSDTTYFYSPVSPKLKKVDLSDMIGFDSLEAAKASGRKPDPVSLRLTAPPGYPSEPPAPGECIGRALPFFRPCRRPAKGPSGLCEYCQRGE